MEATRDEVEKAIVGKLEGTRDNSAHRNISVYVDGQFVGKASISHSWRRLDAWRLGKVARQLYVSTRQLYDVVKCTKNLDWYREYLRNRGVL